MKLLSILIICLLLVASQAVRVRTSQTPTSDDCQGESSDTHFIRECYFEDDAYSFIEWRSIPQDNFFFEIVCYISDQTPDCCVRTQQWTGVNANFVQDIEPGCDLLNQRTDITTSSAQVFA